MYVLVDNGTFITNWSRVRETVPSIVSFKRMYEI